MEMILADSRVKFEIKYVLYVKAEQIKTENLFYKLVNFPHEL